MPRTATTTRVKKGSLSARAVAIEILADSGDAMQMKELVVAALADSRSRKMAGKTPGATLSAQLYVAIKQVKQLKRLDGTEGQIEKVEKGVVRWAATSS